jgi:hypothetical protein
MTLVKIGDCRHIALPGSDGIEGIPLGSRFQLQGMAIDQNESSPRYETLPQVEKEAIVRVFETERFPSVQASHELNGFEPFVGWNPREIEAILGEKALAEALEQLVVVAADPGILGSSGLASVFGVKQFQSHRRAGAVHAGYDEHGPILGSDVDYHLFIDRLKPLL